MAAKVKRKTSVKKKVAKGPAATAPGARAGVVSRSAVSGGVGRVPPAAAVVARDEALVAESPLPPKGWQAKGLMTWRDRVWRLLSGKELDGEISREKMADLQAAVLNELAHLKQQGKSAVSGRPFEGMFMGHHSGKGADALMAGLQLPSLRKRLPSSWPRWSRLGLALLLVLAILVVLYQGRTPPGPARVLDEVQHSLASRDVAAFERRVDVAAVATSAVNQLFGSSRLGLDSLPDVVRNRLESQSDRGGVRARLEAFLKPGLSENLKDEALLAVGKGSFAAAPEGLLHKLWQDAGGERLRFGRVRVVSADAERAVGELVVSRPDLNLTLPLRLEMDRLDGHWQVVDVPNLADVLNQISVTAAEWRETKSAQTVAELGRLVTVTNVTKARTDDGRLLVGARLTNAGPVDLRGLRVQLVFADAAGQPMKVVVVEEPARLAAGTSVEKNWTVLIDEHRSLERYVRDLPLAALTLRAGVIGLTMANGQTLETDISR